MLARTHPEVLNHLFRRALTRNGRLARRVSWRSSRRARTAVEAVDFRQEPVDSELSLILDQITPKVASAS